MRKIPLKIIGISTLVYVLVALCVNVSYNMTPSLPYTWYFVNQLNKNPNIGDVIETKPPKNAYPSLRKKPDLLKQVIGVSGDTITVNDHTVRVNDVVMTAKPQLESGRSLEIIRPQQIGGGKYFVYTPHKDSYDSRYAEIGLISQDQIIGVAYGFIKRKP